MWRATLPAMLVLAILSGGAQSAVVDFRAALEAEPTLQHLFTFEGATTGERQQDKKGTLHLTPSAYGGSGNVSAISYVAGLDGLSAALKPQAVDATASSGAALRNTSNSLSTGASITVETLIRPSAKSGNTPGYVVAGGGSPTRAYYLLQREGDLKVAAGSAAFADGGALRDVWPGYVNGHWYYAATTLTNSGGNTIVNSYAADLSAGETKLTQTLSNATIAGNFQQTNNPLGVGMFGATANEAFIGLIDEVAIHNGAVGAAALQSHLDALTAPDMARMRFVVSNTPGLIHHYTFEGADAAQRQQDKVASGALNLTPASYGAGSTGALAYEPGFDDSTTAFTPQRLTNGGAGLRSTGSLTKPPTMTIEAIVQPENLPNNDWGYGIMAGGTPTRGYFLLESFESGDDGLAVMAGNETFNPRRLLNPFEPGHWYYVANTFEYDSANNRTILSSYLADLTEGQFTLRKVLDGVAVNGTFTGTAPLGIGIFNTDGVSFAQAWSGSLDEIALYDRILDAEELQFHLTSLMGVPEPSSLALGLLGLLCAATWGAARCGLCRPRGGAPQE